MNRITKQILYLTTIIVFSVIFSTNHLYAQDYPLDEVDHQIQEYAKRCNLEIISLFEALLDSGSLALAQLFDTFYIPVPDTEPPKYSTQYDKIVEKSLQTILDNYLNKNNKIIYVMAVDKYGYLPSQNSKFSHSHVGNKEDLFKKDKEKRILNDRIGLAASKNKTTCLVQQYFLDSGEEIKDFSIPLFLRNRHWGAVRFGYTLK